MRVPHLIQAEISLPNTPPPHIYTQTNKHPHTLVINLLTFKTAIYDDKYKLILTRLQENVLYLLLEMKPRATEVIISAVNQIS